MTRPAARPIALSAAHDKPSVALLSAPIRPAKVPSSRPVLRISSRQLDRIASDLSFNDQAVIDFVADVRLATGAQIARRLWASNKPTDSHARAARRALARLEAWRVLDRLPHRMGGVRGGSASIVYFLGPAGARLLTRRGFTPKKSGFPGQHFAAHRLDITELLVRLHEGTMVGDLDLLEHQTEPRCWRFFLTGFGRRITLRPDLFVRIGAGAYEDRYFIEVDRATEASPTVLAQARRYLAYYRGGEEQHRHGVFPRVIWTVPDRRRAEQIERTLARLSRGDERLFSVWLYDEVIGRLTAEARS
jgi:hypothetical protein